MMLNPALALHGGELPQHEAPKSSAIPLLAAGLAAGAGLGMWWALRR
jgi:hypothetical protein